MRICTRCKKKLSLKVYRPRSSVCNRCIKKNKKACDNASGRRASLTRYRHSDKYKEAQRRYWATLGGKEKRKHYKLERNFGITLVQYDQMLIDQNSNCLICGINRSKLSRSLVVDHDHITGKVRGLLCDLCNRGLGSFKDNLEHLKCAVSYLKRHTRGPK